MHVAKGQLTVFAGPKEPELFWNSRSNAAGGAGTQLSHVLQPAAVTCVHVEGGRLNAPFKQRLRRSRRGHG